MPGIKVPNAGERGLLDLLRAALEDGGAMIRLTNSSGVLLDTLVIGDLGEAWFSGYAAVPLTGGVVLPDPDIGGRAVVGWDLATFAHNGGISANTIHGYYVTDADETVLYWAEFFPEPINMAVNGDTIEVVPQLRLKSEH